MLGEEVETLIDDFQLAGFYTKVFLATSNLTSGIYFYRLQTNNFICTKKFVLLK
ncbi:MAG: T9SS C-terminal target domain-containing protein [Ignavibacteriales bacterium]|nr:MAG: T9SS C-terminal target domain-containing protein [Ignavibacteriales bacterium]